MLTLAALTSCANSYNIQGSSNVQMLDGRMLYLKVHNNNDLKNVDSCDVVHGQFHFTGNGGHHPDGHALHGRRGHHAHRASKTATSPCKHRQHAATVCGTPLNDKLFKFIDKYNQLQNLVNELGHKQSQAIMDGEDEQVTNERLNQE